MTFDMLYSKIHRATVTDANLNYVGSITIDEDLMKASNLRVGQKVDIVNINNGERFQTYVIKVEIGDKIIVISYASYNESELENYKPTVVLVDEKNNIELITHELVGSDHV